MNETPVYEVGGNNPAWAASLRLRQNGRVISFSLISRKIDMLWRRLKALPA
jgi:hypothetical protein